MQFFNPKMSSISFGISVLRGTVQINMAKSLDPNIQGRPAKGQKVYDWENSNYYSITPLECIDILNAWKSLMDGTYQNPKEKDARFKTSFGLTHFRDRQPSRMLLYQAKNQQTNQPMGTLMITLVPPQGTQSTTYLFRQNELISFRNYIECGAKYLDFSKDMFDGIKRSEAAAQRKSNGGGFPSADMNNYRTPPPGGNPNYSSFDNLGGGQPGPVGNPQQSPPPQNNPQLQNEPPVENIGSIDNMNFDWNT